MDFEDSGIESDPKNSTEKDTLKQHNEPIISFSPERCRFDSAQSSSRKSSTSFPISVADLQLDEPLPSLAKNNLNSITNFQNLSKTTKDGVPSSKTTSIHQLNEHTVNQPLFTNAPKQQQLKQVFPFLHNQQQQQQNSQNPSLSTHCSISSLSSSTPLQAPAATLVISSTHALSSTTSSSASTTTSATAKNRPIPTTLLHTRSSLDSPSISLMVNGAVLSANNNATTTTPTGTSSSSTTLDLQKRLEKRIAQASAIAAAAAASSATNNTTSTSSSTTLSSTTAAETKGNDSILSDIISSASGIANKAITIPTTASTANSSSGKNYGNQISFSPQSPTTIFSEQLNFKEEKVMPSTSPTLWEADPSSSSSAIDLWGNKIASGGGVGDGFIRAKESIADSFMDVSQTSQVHTTIISNSQQQPISASINDILGKEKSAESGSGTTPADCMAQLDLTCNSAAAAVTTSCTTINTSGGGGSGVTTTRSTCTGGGSANSKNNNNIGSINKSSSSKNNTSNKPKGNQSLRNNNNPTTSNVPGGDAAASSLSSTAACGGGGGSAPTPGTAAAVSSSSASVITVVNASFDIRKVSALLPPQRLAIPSKSNPQLQSSHSVNAKTRSGSCSSSSLSATNNPSSGTATVTFSSFASNTSSSNNIGASNPPPSASAYGSSSSAAAVHKTSTSSRRGSISETSCTAIIQPPSGNGNIKTGSHNSSKLSTDSEKKPLVQWDSDESEEELSFFPPAKRGVITDNLSIDNMSLSGEEEDLHLTPPRPLAKKCPCDPRSWLDRTDISSSHHHHGDPTRSISSKFSCVIS